MEIQGLCLELVKSCMSKKEKLVRDLIPAIILAEDRNCEFRYASDQERIQLLVDKLTEEAEELVSAENFKARLEEAGDLFEVCQSLISAYGISIDDAKKAADRKKSNRGAFKLGVVLKTL